VGVENCSHADGPQDVWVRGPIDLDLFPRDVQQAGLDLEDDDRFGSIGVRLQDASDLLAPSSPEEAFLFLVSEV
jgi:hypothetical protein